MYTNYNGLLEHQFQWSIIFPTPLPADPPSARLRSDDRSHAKDRLQRCDYKFMIIARGYNTGSHLPHFRSAASTAVSSPNPTMVVFFFLNLAAMASRLATHSGVTRNQEEQRQIYSSSKLNSNMENRSGGNNRFVAAN
ncbi:hypothetical protein ACLOJK_034291 [Asimina triloba]